MVINMPKFCGPQPAPAQGASQDDEDDFDIASARKPLSLVTARDFTPRLLAVIPDGVFFRTMNDK